MVASSVDMQRRLLLCGRAPALPLSLISLLLLVALAGCKPPEDRSSASSTGSLTITAQLPQNPPVGPAPMAITVTRADGSSVANAAVKVEGNMTHAGMVPVLVDAVEVGDGVYRADDMRFTMAGDWIVTITVTENGTTSGGGGRSSASMPVTVRR